MALASWPTKRILMMWAGGLTLQVLLILAPVLLARHLMANRAEMLRVGAEVDARWRTAELADSLSLAKQRAEARATGSYSITPRGETLFALVHMPSGRPDAAVAADLRQQMQRKVRYTTVIILGFIPTVLVILTLSWIIARHHDAGPRTSFGAR